MGKNVHISVSAISQMNWTILAYWQKNPISCIPKLNTTNYPNYIKQPGLKFLKESVSKNTVMKSCSLAVSCLTFDLCCWCHCREKLLHCVDWSTGEQGSGLIPNLFTILLAPLPSFQTVSKPLVSHRILCISRNASSVLLGFPLLIIKDVWP